MKDSRCWPIGTISAGRFSTGGGPGSGSVTSAGGAGTPTGGPDGTENGSR